MTRIHLGDALAELRLAARLTGDGSVQAIDAALVQVTKLGSSESIGPLLLMLDDGATYDEGMFSLIHAAEAFEDAVYVRELLAALPRLCISSQKWASIVLMRVLNNGSTRAELVRALRDADAAVKQAAKQLCENINERSPKSSGKTLSVLVAVE